MIAKSSVVGIDILGKDWASQELIAIMFEAAESTHGYEFEILAIKADLVTKALLSQTK
jgi:hypothetical protein